MSAPKVDVLAVLEEAADWLHRSSECRGDDERAANVKQARSAVAEMITADREYDAALDALRETVRKVAEGWLEIEFDALRKAQMRTVRAQSRRAAALARIVRTS